MSANSFIFNAINLLDMTNLIEDRYTFQIIHFGSNDELSLRSTLMGPLVRSKILLLTSETLKDTVANQFHCSFITSP